MKSKDKHVPVLLKESIEALNLRKGNIVIDATLGEGGHAIEIAKKIGKKGKVVAIDIDPLAIVNFERKIKNNYSNLASRFILKNRNFSQIKKIVEEERINKVDAILADLGWRLAQAKEDNYGFGFLSEKLDMRLGGEKQGELTAEKIINNWKEKQLFYIFRKYGQEKRARRAAYAICQRRKIRPIESARDLAEIIKEALEEKKRNQRKKGIHLATRIFQALRMVVNRELENLEDFLKGSVDVLRERGRLAVISFHSIEDKVIKDFFRANARGCVCPKESPVCVCGAKKQIRIINRRPIFTSFEEKHNNRRSRSARLRIVEKI